MIFKLEQLVDEVGELSRQFIFHIPEITSNRIEQLNDLLLMKIKQVCCHVSRGDYILSNFF
jgi:hypothetical protein